MLTIKQVHVDDTTRRMDKQLIELMDKRWANDIGIPAKYSPVRDEEQFTNPGVFFHVLLNDKAIGMVVLGTSDLKGVMWLSSMFIEEEHRGKGYGTEVLQELKILLKEKGYKAFIVGYLESNPAKRLYDRAGFNKVLSTCAMIEL